MNKNDKNYIDIPNNYLLNLYGEGSEELLFINKFLDECYFEFGEYFWISINPYDETPGFENSHVVLLTAKDKDIPLYIFDYVLEFRAFFYITNPKTSVNILLKTNIIPMKPSF